MSGQFGLLKTRRFAPFFATQFLGAFNDNLFKNALVVLLTFQSAQWTAMRPEVLANLAAGIFILPFFLFSATCGQLADKYDKAMLARMVKVLERLSFFYHEESCGQCTPCREGTAWMYKVVHRIENGQGKPEDLDLLNSVLGNIAGRTICALGDAAAFPVQSFLKHFGSEFEYHIEHKTCLVPKDIQWAGSGFHKIPA